MPAVAPRLDPAPKSALWYSPNPVSTTLRRSSCATLSCTDVAVVAMKFTLVESSISRRTIPVSVVISCGFQVTDASMIGERMVANRALA